MKTRDLLEEIKENIKDYDIEPFEERVRDENTDQTSKLRANFHIQNYTEIMELNIDENDEVVGMITYDPSAEDASAHSILVVSEHGYGKRSDFDEYRKTNRGGKGVKTLNITEKTGSLVAIKNVTDENDLMIINRSGLTIRMAVSGIKVAGRATQGVRLINIKEGDSIAAVSAVNKTEEENQVEVAQAPDQETPVQETNN